jgi:hypothetical protein
MNTVIARVGAVAGLLLSAVAGQAAQSFDVKFNFRTPAGEHPAGAYMVDVNDHTSTATRIVYLRNLETRRTVMFYPVSGIEKRQAAEGPAKLKFKCGNAGCNLAEIWTDPNFGWAVRQPKLSPAEAERMTVSVPARNTPSE